MTTLGEAMRVSAARQPSNRAAMAKAAAEEAQLRAIQDRMVAQMLRDQQIRLENGMPNFAMPEGQHSPKRHMTYNPHSKDTPEQFRRFKRFA